MEYSFTGICKLTMEAKPGDKTSTHIKTDVRLEISPNLSKKVYFTPDEMPTKEAVKPITLAFVSGLAANVHSAHQAGHWDSAEHLRYIIAELERQFAQVANVYKSTM